MPDQEKKDNEKLDVENLEVTELEDEKLEDVSGGFTDNCNCTIKAAQ